MPDGRELRDGGASIAVSGAISRTAMASRKFARTFTSVRRSPRLRIHRGHLRRKPGPSGPGGAGLCGPRSGPSPRSQALFDVVLDDRQRSTAAGSGEVKWQPEMAAPQVLPGMAQIFLAQPAGRDAFAATDELRQRRAGRVVHEQVKVIGLAVELAQLGRPATSSSPSGPSASPPGRWPASTQPGSTRNSSRTAASARSSLSTSATPVRTRGSIDSPDSTRPTPLPGPDQNPVDPR